MNLLLIDYDIPGLDIFIKSCNSSTKCIVYDSKKVTFPMLDKKIASLNVTRYNNLGFVFVNNYNVDMLFIDNKPFINYNETGIIDNTTTSFIKYLVKKYFVKTIDFLACNLLENSIWKLYFDFIRRQNNVKVRASNDRTGNLSSGGDWILESTGENVEKLYFNDNIQYWNYLLDSGSESDSTFVITSDNSNNLYSCGFNDKGQLGLGNNENKNSLQNVLTNISNKKVIAVASGQKHSLFITNETTNNLYTCGYNAFGQLGLNDNTDRNTFQNVSLNSLLISGKKIINVCAGSNHSLILTNEATNNLYSCGRNLNSTSSFEDFGQLGLGDTENRNTFQNVTLNISDKKIIQISAGGNTSLLLTNDTNNNLYSCGYNNDGQLGLGNQSAYTTFQNVTLNISSKKIIEISSGLLHSLLLTNEAINNLYTCGSNFYGQLGFSPFTGFPTTQFTNIAGGEITNKNITFIAGGGYHSLILTNDTSNNVYSTGVNDFGQLGVANFEFRRDTFTNVFNNILNKYYTGIFCTNHSSFLVSSDQNNNFYVVGDNNNGQLNLNNNIPTFNIFLNSTFNILNKKIIFNKLINSSTPNAPSFNGFNYGTNNTTYYPSAQDRENNIISINVISNPEILFSNLIGTIGEAYSLSPLSTIFALPIAFTIKAPYLSKVYYQYTINSNLLVMSNSINQLPYYSYDGNKIIIYTTELFAYIVITRPPNNTGSQFSNLNNLIISATDEPSILPNAQLNYTFYNTPSVSVNDSNQWDVSASTTMSSMFRDSSFNGIITNWKPKQVTDMSYMFNGAKLFNQKMSYNQLNGYWDVSSVTNMESIFNSSTLFNNSQEVGGVTEPMNWNLNPNVNISNNIINSGLTVANAQTLAPDKLVYLNVGNWTRNINSSSSVYDVQFKNEDGTVGITSSTNANTVYNFFCTRYNIAGDTLWSVKINNANGGLNGGPNEGSISTDLSRNVIIAGRWYNPGSIVRFYDANDVSNVSLQLDFSGTALQTSFIVKYNSSGYSQWRARIFGSTGEQAINSTYCDASGNIYAGGRFQGDGTFQDSSLNTWATVVGGISNSKSYILRYNSNGTSSWLARTTNSSSLSQQTTYQVIVDSDNNVYGIGTYDTSGTIIYDGSSNGTGSEFKTLDFSGSWLAKYNSVGKCLWATNFYGGGNIYATNLGYSLNSDVFFGGGYFLTSPTFMNQDGTLFNSITDISAGNGIISKYTSDGYGSWIARISCNTSINGAYITNVCSEKQFQDIDYPEQGIRFSIYNGYFDNLSDKFGFFYSNYPYATGVTSNLSDLSSSTIGKYTSGEYRSVCWWGFFKAKKTGIYTFTTASNDASYLMINGNIVVDNGGTHGTETVTVTGTCSLIAGTYYYIQIFYGNLTGGQAFGAGYTEPGGTFISNATGLGSYFTDSTQYIGLYDNWVNQSTYAPNATMTITNRNENYLNINTTGLGPQLDLLNRPAINPNIYKYIHLKYKIVSGTPDVLSIFYGSNQYPFSESRKINYTYPTPISNIIGTWQNAVIDMTNVTNWYSDNWINWRLNPLVSGTNIQFEYFFVSDTPNYPLNETGNNIYATGFTKGDTNGNSIYNSSFFYNTKGLGFSGTSNSLFKTYTSNNNNEKTYIIKYNLNGECVWSIFLESGLNVRPSGINVDKTGNIYVYIQYTTSIAIKDKNGIVRKTYTTPIVNAINTVVICYSDDGLYLWSSTQTVPLPANASAYLISSGLSNSYIGSSMALS